MGPTIKHHDRMLSIELWSKKNFKKFGRHFEDKTSKQHYLIGLLNLSHWSDPIYIYVYFHLFIIFDLLLADMLWSYVFNSPRTWLFWLPLATSNASEVLCDADTSNWAGGYESYRVITSRQFVLISMFMAAVSDESQARGYALLVIFQAAALAGSQTDR